MELQVLLNTIQNLMSDVKVTSQTVQKGNETLVGISIGSGDVRPIMYLKNYENLFEKEGYLAVAKQMIEDYKQVGSPKLNADFNEFSKYAKDNLILCIAPFGTNNGNVTVPYLDLELYFRIDMKNAGVPDGTCKVTEQMFKIWNITKETLIDAALERSNFVTESMREMMIRMMLEDGVPEEFIEEIKKDTSPDQVIFSNETKLYGASAIYDKSILKEVADKYKSDLYIIPSSIHEVLLVSTQFGNKEDMDDMVRTVNRTELQPSEVLSDHAYIFRRDTMDIEW